jgi:hypothetical protein
MRSTTGNELQLFRDDGGASDQVDPKMCSELVWSVTLGDYAKLVVMNHCFVLAIEVNYLLEYIDVFGVSLLSNPFDLVMCLSKVALNINMF